MNKMKDAVVVLESVRTSALGYTTYFTALKMKKRTKKLSRKKKVNECTYLI